MLRGVISKIRHRRACVHDVSLETAQDTTPTPAPYCRYCYSDFANEAPIVLKCGHTFCRSCLNACFRTGVENRASFPPSCCKPGEGIDLRLVEQFLDDAVIQRYNRVEPEYSIKNPIWCASKPCSKLFLQQEQQPSTDNDNDNDHHHPNPPSRKSLPSLTRGSGNNSNSSNGNSRKFLKCTDCQTETCAQCKQDRASHGGRRRSRCPRLSGISAEDRALARQNKWKMCPTCKIVIEKSEACPHMTCSECGTHFCYHCGSEFTYKGWQLPHYQVCKWKSRRSLI